jgi:hypothetical protein
MTPPREKSCGQASLGGVEANCRPLIHPSPSASKLSMKIPGCFPQERKQHYSKKNSVVNPKPDLHPDQDLFFPLPTGYQKDQRCFKNKIKGSRQRERRAVGNMSNGPNLSRTAATDVLFSINSAVVFDFIHFRFRPNKAK